MARVDIKLPDEFLSKISNLGEKEDHIAEKVLEEGAKIVYDEVKTKLRGVIGSGTKYPSRSTGELERSLGIAKMLVDLKGNHNVKVGLNEPRKDGESNAKIANIIEYGKHGLGACPCLPYSIIFAILAFDSPSFLGSFNPTLTL